MQPCHRWHQTPCLAGYGLRRQVSVHGDRRRWWARNVGSSLACTRRYAPGLNGRSGRTPAAPAITMSNSILNTRIVRADAGCSEDVRNSASRSDARHPTEPLVIGLLHSGVTLMDAPIHGLTVRSFRFVRKHASVTRTRRLVGVE
jgi:hypothetical protein